jgi:hypothetical protein
MEQRRLSVALPFVHLPNWVSTALTTAAIFGKYSSWLEIRTAPALGRSRLRGPAHAIGRLSRENHWSGAHDPRTPEDFGDRFIWDLVSSLPRGAARNRTCEGGLTSQTRHRICGRRNQRRWGHAGVPAILRPAAARYTPPRFRSGRKSAQSIRAGRISGNGSP